MWIHGDQKIDVEKDQKRCGDILILKFSYEIYATPKFEFIERVEFWWDWVQVPQGTGNLKGPNHGFNQKVFSKTEGYAAEPSTVRLVLLVRQVSIQ